MNIAAVDFLKKRDVDLHPELNCILWFSSDKISLKNLRMMESRFQLSHYLLFVHDGYLSQLSFPVRYTNSDTGIHILVLGVNLLL